MGSARTSDFGDLLFQTGVWIAIAFFAVVRFLSYIDRRIRLEGWEIELRLKSVGRRWRRATVISLVVVCWRRLPLAAGRA